MPDFCVYGQTIGEQLQAALLARMKAGPFKASDIEAEACRLGVPRLTDWSESVAMRAADRIIQRERKAGNIRLLKPHWVWVGD